MKTSLFIMFSAFLMLHTASALAQPIDAQLLHKNGQKIQMTDFKFGWWETDTQDFYMQNPENGWSGVIPLKSVSRIQIKYYGSVEGLGKNRAKFIVTLNSGSEKTGYVAVHGFRGFDVDGIKINYSPRDIKTIYFK